MEKTYVISWKARRSGRTGEGKRRMDREEAERLAEELNQEYPEYEHFVVNPGAQTGEALSEAVAANAAAPETALSEGAIAPSTPADFTMGEAA